MGSQEKYQWRREKQGKSWGVHVSVFKFKKEKVSCLYAEEKASTIGKNYRSGAVNGKDL